MRVGAARLLQRATTRTLGVSHMASHNEEREQSYESEVRRNAYRLRIEVQVEDGIAYLISEGKREILCKPLIAKKFWYETWLALKARCGDLPDFIKRP